jgi:GNAT superfamily N-acetyltransferase
VDVRDEPASSFPSRRLIGEYADLLRERGVEPDFDLDDGLERFADECSPPSGAWFVLYRDGEPVGCGGLRPFEPGVAEIKRMYVAEEARGTGLGRRLLEALELRGRQAGYSVIRLDSASGLTEALGLYRSAAYREVGRYNDNPSCDVWFEKQLGG